MDRRSFLRLLGMSSAVASASAVLDLDRLLWVPGAKTIFIPETVALYGNQFVSPAWVTRQIALAMTNSLKFTHTLAEPNARFRFGGVIPLTVPVRWPTRFSLS